MEGEKRPPLPQWGMAASAGSTLVGCVIGGIFLDMEFGWSPWATLAGIGLGLISCISILMLAAKRS